MTKIDTNAVVSLWFLLDWLNVTSNSGLNNSNYIIFMDHNWLLIHFLMNYIKWNYPEEKNRVRKITKKKKRGEENRRVLIGVDETVDTIDDQFNTYASTMVQISRDRLHVITIIIIICILVEHHTTGRWVKIVVENLVSWLCIISCIFDWGLCCCCESIHKINQEVAFFVNNIVLTIVCDLNGAFYFYCHHFITLHIAILLVALLKHTFYSPTAAT